MKKLFYSFLLIIVSFFVLSSCNNNKNEVEDDSKYQVTKEEFEKAFDFSSIENCEIIAGRFGDSTEYKAQYIIDYRRVFSDNQWTYYRRSGNPYYPFSTHKYEDYCYNKENLSYEKISDSEFYYYNNISIKFENKRITYIEVDDGYYSVTYDNVENFEVPQDLIDSNN